MTIADLLFSPPVPSVAQIFFHSVVAFVVVERSVRAWRIADPGVEQKFRLMVILLPLLAFPVYLLLDRHRGSALFRLDSIFDSTAWLSIEVPHGVPVTVLFLALLGLTSLLFVFQELVPMVRHARMHRASGPAGARPCGDPKVLDLLGRLGGGARVLLVDRDDAVIFTTSDRGPVITLSTGLLERLTDDQLAAVLAHELAHARRSRSPLLVVTYLLRLVMFWSPVVLLEFRRMAQLEEMVCDDMAAGATGKPGELAATLRLVHWKTVRDPGAPASLLDRIEIQGHRLNLESRIARLERASSADRGRGWTFKWMLTAAAILVVNYFVV